MDKKTKSTIETTILFTILQILIGTFFLPGASDSIESLAPESGARLLISISVVPAITLIVWIISFIIIIARKFKANENWLIPLLLAPITLYLILIIYYFASVSLSEIVSSILFIH